MTPRRERIRRMLDKLDASVTCDWRCVLFGFGLGANAIAWLWYAQAAA